VAAFSEKTAGDAEHHRLLLSLADRRRLSSRARPARSGAARSGAAGPEAAAAAEVLEAAIVDEKDEEEDEEEEEVALAALCLCCASPHCAGCAVPATVEGDIDAGRGGGEGEPTAKKKKPRLEVDAKQAGECATFKESCGEAAAVVGVRMEVRQPSQITAILLNDGTASCSLDPYFSLENL
jgi:hypothetical protein